MEEGTRVQSADCVEVEKDNLGTAKGLFVGLWFGGIFWLVLSVALCLLHTERYNNDDGRGDPGHLRSVTPAKGR